MRLGMVPVLTPTRPRRAPDMCEHCNVPNSLKMTQILSTSPALRRALYAVDNLAYAGNHITSPRRANFSQAFTDAVAVYDRQLHADEQAPGTPSLAVTPGAARRHDARDSAESRSSPDQVGPPGRGSPLAELFSPRSNLPLVARNQHAAGSAGTPSRNVAQRAIQFFHGIEQQGRMQTQALTQIQVSIRPGPDTGPTRAYDVLF